MRVLHRSFAGPPRAAPTCRRAAPDACASRAQGGQALGHQRQVAIGDSDPDATESDHVHWADAQDAADCKSAVVAADSRTPRRRPLPRVGYRARPNERLVEFDAIGFHALVPGGGDNEVRGYSLECPWHIDCVRYLSLGTGTHSMTQEECRRRLLAWAADGKDIDRAMRRLRGRSTLLMR